jgi:protein-S-isoprenylcysteine O-methyltransferase Ste14
MASTRRSIVASVLFTLFGGPGLVLLLIPWVITRFRVPPSEPLAQIVFACFLIAAGLVPLLDSIVRFVVVGRGSLMPTTPTEHLVVSGLYRYVRNPMYVGVATTIAGEAILFSQLGLLVELVFVALAFVLFVRLYEEPKLARTFPAEYAEYKRHVRRWLPRLTAWRSSTSALQ